jgi:outer membrane biosynthesis protein TonB
LVPTTTKTMSKEATSKPSWDDFKAKNPFDDDEDSLFNEQEEEVEEEEIEEEDEQEEDEVPAKKKEKPGKAKSTKKEKEESEEEESESEEEDETPKVKKKETPKTKVKAEEEEEETQETEEETEEETESDGGKEFFEEVSRITGNEVDVDYGDTDPLSPQGVALRENAIKALAIDSIFEEIETKYPKVFKALQHASAGGDISELFKVTAGKDYSKITIGDEDDATAKQVLTDYYRAKGIKSEARIAKLIQEDEDDATGIVAIARGYLKELQDEQSAAENQVLEAQKARATEEKKRDSVLLAAIDEVIQGGKLGNWKFASKQDATDFRKFLDGKIRKLGDGKYEFGLTIEPANMEKTLQYMFFAKNGGDLTKFIQIKASSDNAKKLRLGIQKEGATNKAKATGVEQGKKKLSLRDYSITE